MSAWDAFIGNAPEIQKSDLAQAYQGQGLNFADPYSQGIGADTAMRARQLSFLDALQQQAQGAGPGADLARAQMQNDLNRVNAATASQIASARGLNPAQAVRLAAQQQAATNQGIVAGANATRAQQQLGAQGQLGQALMGIRGQEQGLAGMSAQGQQAQEALRAQNFNEAQRQNLNVGMQQAQMQQAADQGGLNAITGAVTQLAGAVIPPLGAAQAAAKAATKVAGMAHGGSVALDSQQQDDIPVMLQRGETVVPASLHGRDRQDFLEALDSLQGGGIPGRQVSADAFLKALAARDAHIERRIQRLEELLGGRQ